MKFGEGRGFCDTILKTEKELVLTTCTGYGMGEGQSWKRGGGKRREGGGKGGAGGERETRSELGDRCL
jgi:hypothetical protein